MSRSISLSGVDWFEALIESFERDWRAGSPAEIAGIMALVGDQASKSAKVELLEELIKVDLEYRWRESNLRSGRGGVMGPKLEVYVKRFPQLGPRDELPLDLIREEYLARRRFGDQPTHSEYQSRFSRHGRQLTALLEDTDREIDRESSAATKPPPPVRRAARFAIDPEAPLSYTDYQLQRQIGAGGICKVYTALQRSLDKPVAVKVLKKCHLENDRLIARFLNEAKTAARFRHGNIVGVHGVGRLPDDGFFMVMDLVDGSDLSFACQPKHLSANDVARIIHDLACAVHHLHEQGIVHCDLKPSNVLLSSAGQVAITDFGFARTIDPAANAVERDCDGGTIAYMAPEQFDPRFGEIGRHTDVYGIGGVLYSLLVGSPPYQGLSPSEILAQGATSVSVTIPSETIDATIKPLAEICHRCLKKSISERWLSAKELAEAIARQRKSDAN